MFQNLRGFGQGCLCFSRNFGHSADVPALNQADNHIGLAFCRSDQEFFSMNGIVYLVGLVVIVMAILSFIGLR